MKTTEQLLEEQNRLLAEQNELLRQSAASSSRYIETVEAHRAIDEREAARRKAFWWGKPATHF